MILEKFSNILYLTINCKNSSYMYSIHNSIYYTTYVLQQNLVLYNDYWYEHCNCKTVEILKNYSGADYETESKFVVIG